eukprot:scaffold106602_cov51-Phaeocystis_antarctica.AAC.2
MRGAHPEHVAHVRDTGRIPARNVRVKVLHVVEEPAHVGDARDVPVGNGAVCRNGGGRVRIVGLDRCLQGGRARERVGVGPRRRRRRRRAGRRRDRRDDRDAFGERVGLVCRGVEGRLNRVRDAGVVEGFGTDRLERGHIRQIQAREFGLKEGVLPDLLDGRAQLERARELALALQEVVWDDLQVRVDELPDNLPVGALLHAFFGEDALLHICPAQQVVCVEAAPLGGLQRHLENGQRGGVAAPGCQVALCGYPALPEDDGRQMHTTYMVQTTMPHLVTVGVVAVR